MLKASVKHLIWWSLMLAMLIGLILIGVRFALPKAGEYREEIAGYLGERLGVELSIAELDARWDGYFPALTLGGLRVFSETEQGPEVRLSIARVELQLDPWRSLLRRQPVFKHLELTSPHGLWYQRTGRWLHRPGAGEGGRGMSDEGWQRLLNLLLSQPEVRIREADLLLLPEQGTARRLESIDALLENAGVEHQLSGNLKLQGLGEDTRLQFAIQFEGAPEKPLQGDYPFYLKLESLGPELFELFDVDLPLSRLRAGTEFWGNWQSGRVQSLQGRLAVGELEYGEEGRRVALDNSVLDFALLPLGTGYQLQLNAIHLNSRGEAFDLEQVILEGGISENDPYPARVAVPTLDLNAFNNWLLSQSVVPEQVGSALEALAPDGRLDNLIITWPEQAQWRDFRLRAEARDLSARAYYGAPALDGVSGLIKADIQRGELHLGTTKFAMHFPKLYDRGWTFSRASGVVKWELESDAALIHSELLHLSDDRVTGDGRFSIHIPYDGERQTALTLMIGMSDSDGTQAQRFTPAEEVGQGLYNWLGTAIEAGSVRQAGLLLHGGTRKLESGHPPTVQLFFDIGDAILKYDPDWPVVSDADLFLYIRNGDLRADIRHARLLDSNVAAGWAYKPLRDERLQLAFQMSGPAADLTSVLHSKPLRQSVGDALGDWRIEGTHDTELNLGIPVIKREKASAAPDVRVRSHLSDGVLSSESLKLKLSRLQGDLSFTTESGLSSGELTGELFGRQLGGRIVTKKGITSVEMKGVAPLSELQTWTGVAALDLMTGELGYDAWLVLCNAQKNCASRLELRSDLAGVRVDLPGEFGLAAADKKPLSVSVALVPQELAFSYDEQLSGLFDLAETPLRGTLHLGRGEAQFRADPGLYVDGSLQRLEVSDTLTLLDTLDSLPSTGEAPATAGETLREVVLDIAETEVGGFNLQAVHARLVPVDVGWLLQLAGENINGAVTFPADGQAIEVALERLAIGTAVDGDSGQVDGAADEPLFSVRDMQPVDLSILSLAYRGRDLGRWSVQLRPDGDRLDLQQLRGDLSQLTVRGDMSWLQDAQQQSALTLRVEGEDIGRQLELWGMDSVLESQLLESDLKLEWQGAPWDMNAATLDGTVQFLLKDGRIIESGNSANLLRVFGILNFNTLGRRLRLDFSDLFKKGVAFDRLKGSYELSKGIAQTTEPLEMEGPSANFKATGSLNLVDETVDKDVEVALPLASNVPFAAVLLGAPQVAGAVFLIDKIIGDKLERVTTLRYGISGDWGDPQVALKTAPPKQTEEP